MIMHVISLSLTFSPVSLTLPLPIESVMTKKNYYCPNMNGHCYMKNALGKVLNHLNTPGVTCGGGRIWTAKDDQAKLKIKPTYMRKPTVEKGTTKRKRSRTPPPPSGAGSSKILPIEL
jgi:hypothetical protein